MNLVNIIIFLNLFTSINLVHTDTEIENYIKEKCEKLSGNFPSEFQQQEKTQNEIDGNFQIWKINIKNSNRKNFLYKMNVGNKKFIRYFFNTIYNLKEDERFENFFSKLSKCYYKTSSNLGSEKFSQFFFLISRSKIDNIETFNLSAKRLSYFKYEFKIYIFLKIVRLFKFLRYKGFLGLVVSLRDLRVNTKNNSIKLPASVFAQMTQINQKEKDLTQLVDINLTKFKDDNLKYIHPLLRENQKNISIEVLEKSDLYNLGIIFLEIFGIKISYVFKNYEEIKILENTVYSSLRRYLGRTISEKNSLFAPISSDIIEEISNYYMELFFRPSEKKYENVLVETDPSIVFVKKLEKEYHCTYYKNKNPKKFIDDRSLEYRILSDYDNVMLPKSYIAYQITDYNFKQNYLNNLIKDYQRFKITHALHFSYKNQGKNIIKKFQTEYFSYMINSDCKVNKDMFYFEIPLLDGTFYLNKLSSDPNFNILHKLVLIKNLALTYKLFANYNFNILNLGEDSIFFSRGREWNLEIIYTNDFILYFTPEKFANIININNDDELLYKELCDKRLEDLQYNFKRPLTMNPDILDFCMNNKKKFDPNFEVYNLGRFAFNMIVPTISLEITKEDIMKNFGSELKKAFDTHEKLKKVSQKNLQNLFNIFKNCLDMNPKKRPNFDKIISELEKILK